LPVAHEFFSEFDTYIQKAKKSILDTRNHSALKNVANELQDVQKIMGQLFFWVKKTIFSVANLDEVLARGTSLDVIQSKSSNLLSYSQQYRDEAKQLNRKSK
jgi:vesicle transport protein SEC22